MTPEGKLQFEEQRKFIPQMRLIVGRALGPLLFTEAPAELDMKENTDLVILKANDIRVACRLRTKNYMKDYLYDVTFRSVVSSGVITEIHKVLAGFGNAFLYGFQDGERIRVWRILNLKIFRELCDGFNGSLDWPPTDFVSFLSQKGIRCGHKPNGDGTGFVYFNVCDLAKVAPKILIESEPRLPPIQLGLI